MTWQREPPVFPLGFKDTWVCVPIYRDPRYYTYTCPSLVFLCLKDNLDLAAPHVIKAISLLRVSVPRDHANTISSWYSHSQK